MEVKSQNCKVVVGKIEGGNEDQNHKQVQVLSRTCKVVKCVIAPTVIEQNGYCEKHWNDKVKFQQINQEFNEKRKIRLAQKKNEMNVNLTKNEKENENEIMSKRNSEKNSFDLEIFAINFDNPDLHKGKIYEFFII